MKARRLAEWCWGQCVLSGEIAGWPEELRRRVARAVGVNPPGSWDTWARVVWFLERKEEWAAGNAGDERAVRSGVRPEWLPVPGDGVYEPQVNDPADRVEPQKPAPAEQISSAGAEGEDPSGVPPLGVVEPAAGAELETLATFHRAGKLPPGWDALVASGRVLGHGRTCGISRCHRPAVAACGTVLRCAEHPPTRGEWGWMLDWTPVEGRACAPNRCYRGCCPSWRPAMVPTMSGGTA